MKRWFTKILFLGLFLAGLTGVSRTADAHTFSFGFGYQPSWWGSGIRVNLGWSYGYSYWSGSPWGYSWYSPLPRIHVGPVFYRLARFPELSPNRLEKYQEEAVRQFEAKKTVYFAQKKAEEIERQKIENANAPVTQPLQEDTPQAPEINIQENNSDQPIPKETRVIENETVVVNYY